MDTNYRVLQTAGRAIFVVWCVTWLPLVFLSLMENPGAPEPSWQRKVHLIMAISGGCYFIGGSAWLIWKSWFAGATALLVLPASLVLLVLGANIGPVTLVLLYRWLHPYRAKSERQPN
jgi:hypothetical protein